MKTSTVTNNNDVLSPLSNRRIGDVRKSIQEHEDRSKTGSWISLGYNPDVKLLMEYIDGHVEFTEEDIHLILGALSVYDNEGFGGQDVDALERKLRHCLEG